MGDEPINVRDVLANMIGDGKLSYDMGQNNFSDNNCAASLLDHLSDEGVTVIATEEYTALVKALEYSVFHFQDLEEWKAAALVNAALAKVKD